ncbi:putative lipase protein [Seiridium cardinale]|uniref:Lipase protein n=1 Tax=Seiridium cardinale TaxID=138064 RepID=A0ABR2Y8L2_9PEZI
MNEQVFAILEWFTEKGLSQGIVPDNLAVIGDSAGGHIMFGVNILAQKHQPQINITYIVFLNPAVKTDALGALTETKYLYFDNLVLTMPTKRKYMD